MHPGKKLLILERGTDQHDNPIVYNLANGMRAAKPPYSELLPTDLPGINASVAKLYGGASSHNYGLVVHGSRKFYEKNWLDLNLPYSEYQRIFRKIERYMGLSDVLGEPRDEASRGVSGELFVSPLPQRLDLWSSFTKFMMKESILVAPKTLNVLAHLGPLGAQSPFREALTQSFGLPVVQDYNSGVGECACSTPQLFIDPITGLRSSVDVTYLKDLRDKVVSSATVDRVWENGVSWYDSKGELQFSEIAPGGKIILSAGAIQTPRILQKSGFPKAGKGLMQHYGFSVVIRIPGLTDFSTGPLAFVQNRRWQIVTVGTPLTDPRWLTPEGGVMSFLFWLLDPKARGEVTPDEIKLNLFPPEDLAEMKEGAVYLYYVIQRLKESYPDLEFIHPREEDFFSNFEERLSLTDHYSGTCRLGLVDPQDFSSKGLS